MDIFILSIAGVLFASTLWYLALHNEIETWQFGDFVSNILGKVLAMVLMGAFAGVLTSFAKKSSSKGNWAANFWIGYKFVAIACFTIIMIMTILTVL